MSTEEVHQQVLAADSLYDVLGVANDASEDEIRKAYRRRALRLHPDRNQTPGAVHAFQKLEHAHTSLLDPRKRYLYDAEGKKALDEFELRGGHDDYEFLDFVVALVMYIGEVASVLKTTARWYVKTGRTTPISEAEEDSLTRLDRFIRWGLLATLVVVSILTGMDLDQRAPMGSLQRNEAQRYIFEQSIPMNASTTAKEVKFYTRWKTSTLGDEKLHHVKSMIAKGVTVQCNDQHGIATALQMRRKQQPGAAKFKSRRVQPPRYRWKWSSEASHDVTFSLDPQCDASQRRKGTARQY